MKIFYLLLVFIFNIFFASLVSAGEKISDIKIEGLQRLDAGLVFNNIPFEINDEIESIDFSKTINLLYKTGYFKNIIIEQEGSVILISVREKPILFELNFFGTETFQPDALKSALNSMNIASGLVLDESELLVAQKEITSQYLANGKYRASVNYEVIPLSNNRVNVNFYIDEGGISRIKEINILGNFNFKSQELLDTLNLKTTNYLSWWNKDDRYSRQTLAGDLEAIKSFYMDKGFLDFKIVSSIVSISKNKKDVFINITLDEGKKYTFGKITVSGDIPDLIDQAEIKKNILIKNGEVFNRNLVNISSNLINDTLGNYGYAFANVNAIPSVDKTNLVVDFNFNIDQGKKIYVRRINIIGNDSSKDEVIRRQLRQYESSWFSNEKIKLSKTRLERTQFFESVTMETPIVPGTPDQVDLNVLLKETNTGKFNIGAGVSSSEGIVGTLGLSQANFLGTGNRVSTSVSLGGINKVYSLSFLDPYWTDDGLSRGISAYYHDIDTADLKTGDYKEKNYGAGLNFGIPLAEFEKFVVGSTFEHVELTLQSTSPPEYVSFCNSVASSNSCDTNNLVFFANWTHNTINNPFFPSEGHNLDLAFDISTPGLDLEYFKIMAKVEKFFPISDSVTTRIAASIGYADEYGDNPYPFFKNFKVGGKSSVRGFQEGSIGKKVLNPTTGSFTTSGGKQMVYFNAETYFPIPFVKKSDSYRLSAFVDGGAAFDNSYDQDAIRYSAGLGALWISPFGPLNVSIAMPLNEKDNDQTEKFQFGMGKSF